MERYWSGSLGGRIEPHRRSCGLHHIESQTLHSLSYGKVMLSFKYKATGTRLSHLFKISPPYLTSFRHTSVIFVIVGIARQDVLEDLFKRLV